MSSTKWTEVSRCLSTLNLRYHVKFVDVPDKEFDLTWLRHVTGDWFDSSFGTFTAISIEWLDINPAEMRQGLLLKPKVINHAEKIEICLTSKSISYFWESGQIRILGYVRNSPV